MRRRYVQQLDLHCWKYFKIKYGMDYTSLNRMRIFLSPINKEVERIG